jgi:hypothetical protein
VTLIAGPLRVDKETWRPGGRRGDKGTRRKGDRGTPGLRDARRLGDEETRNSSRDYPRLRFVDHCDEHPEDLVIRLI